MVTRVQVRMARAALGWGVRELAARAGVSPNTVSRCETGHDALGATLARLRKTLEAAGAEFLGTDGVRLRPRAEAAEARPAAAGAGGRRKG